MWNRFVCSLFVGTLAFDLNAEPTGNEHLDPPSVLDTNPAYYPATRRVPVVEEKFGHQVADPFRWLEDDKNPEVVIWASQQGDLARKVLDALPRKPEFAKRLAEVWNYDSFGVPKKAGGRYFYTKKIGLQNQPILFVSESLDAEPRLLIDPNTLSANGTVALAGYVPNPAGTKIAYLISKSGSDWEELRIRDVQSGHDEPDLIERIKFSTATWTPDGKGFYYARYDDAAQQGGKLQFQKIYFHELGKAQTEDALVYQDLNNPDRMYEVRLSNDSNYLILMSSEGSGRENALSIKDLRIPNSDFKTIVPTFDTEFSYIHNRGDEFIFFTNKSAPNGKVVTVRLSDLGQWRDLIPQSTDVFKSVDVTADGFIVRMMRSAASQISIYNWEGRRIRELALPGLGTASRLEADNLQESERFFSYSSFAQPPQIYIYNTKTGETKLWREAKVSFDPSQFVTEQIFVTSKDGTKVPVFVTRRKSLLFDGTNPTILYGYGGFNFSLTPYFDASRIPWLEAGGVYAVANIRGGGEFGDDWHNRGRLLNKQNVFDDFAAAAKGLIERKYTSSRRLVINGGSNGGLLVAATLSQNPDLFAGAIPEVGVHDMLRFHRFTIGWAWKIDYGNPDLEADFLNLLSYSTIHNLRMRAYPPTLIMTADHDDRVVPAHSFKFAATLQSAQLGTGAILLRVQKDAGHGAGTPTSVLINAHADRCAFALAAMGL